MDLKKCIEVYLDTYVLKKIEQKVFFCCCKECNIFLKNVYFYVKT